MRTSKMKLGRKIYNVFRLSEGRHNEDGIWVNGGVEKVPVRANIQGGLFWNSVKFTEAGEVPKQSISIRSDDPIYMATNEVKGDIIEYDGAYWEVRDCRKYGNLPNLKHWEAMAVIIDSSKLPREVLNG